MAEETYQSLYRRYRPARFGEVLGQDHVTLALRNAVRDGRVGQGYLFSGPRGTGKTSTARILAKALNCGKLDDGEPCGACESCTTIAAQTSFGVIELDAASNNGVDAMRDLVSRASLGTTALRKVYIIDEVHMLSTAAANTLLKTLEEPPPHVVFVLATTDPQKVLPTIKSRVQHYEFHLLSAETLGSLVRSINADAVLGLADDDLDRVVKRGAGSARDALSGLDQAAALGSAEDDVPVAAEVLAALVDRDAGRALAAVASGCATGREPRRLAEETLAALRNAFLAGRAPALVDLPQSDKQRVAEQGRALGPAALVRAMEIVGEALAEMREALDPRVSLEVALVRITAPEADASPGALLERIERLERRPAAGEAAAPVAPEPAPGQKAPVIAVPPARPQPPRAAPAPASSNATPPPPLPTRGGRALGSYRGGDGAPTDRDGKSAVEPLPSRDELTKVWGDVILPGLRGRAKALFAVGRFLRVEGGIVEFALPNAAHRDQCLSIKGDVERSLREHFGRPVPLSLIADQLPADAGDAPVEDEALEAADLRELRDAPKVAPSSPADRVKSAFPGAEEVDQ